jgi:hypothetical protein
MPDDPVQQFLDELRHSGILTAEELPRAADELRSGPPPPFEQAAVRLVHKKILTPYQAGELLAGRAEACVLAGRYRLLEKLGAGGMGTVFRAGDINLDREVAVKVLPPHSLGDPGAVARFEREARALAKVSHPNIVQAHDAGEDRGRHFLVMEYVEGVNLAQLLRDNGRVAPALAADYARQVALGLQHAHEKGLVHRDLKPGNLLITPGRLVKILDLGLARFLQDQVGEPGLTLEGAGLGTPDYMAPEQFRDARRADVRSDIYALGCTLYHLLTGRVPFPGSSLSEKCRAHEQEEPPGFAEVCPDVPAGLGLVVQKMMAKRPADRFRTAGEAAEALLPYVASSSAALPNLRTTINWRRGQLTMTAGAAPRRARRALFGAAVVALVALSALGAAWLLERGEPAGGPETKGNGPAQGSRDGGGKVEPPARPKVLTIANGLTVARDGTGQYTTINAALEHVRPGMTVQVLDRETYREQVVLTGRSAQAGITLEAPQGATLEPPRAGGNLVELEGVPRVTLRGFRLRATLKLKALVLVRQGCPGVVLEDLDCAASPKGFAEGVEIVCPGLTREDDPVTVRNSSFRGLYAGVSIVACGSPANYALAVPARRFVVCNNTFTRCEFGVGLLGAAREVHVVGNRFHSARKAAVQLENLLEGAADILVANNTILESGPALRYWDSEVRGKNVEIRNNLVLGPVGQDALFMDSGGDPNKARGPGDGQAVLRAWRWGQNWREAGVPLAGPYRKAWIPCHHDDVGQAEIRVLSRDPKDAARFLRPAKDSPLTTKGAGGDLPSYVGAVPPEGVEPWDWERTWKARAGKGAEKDGP